MRTELVESLKNKAVFFDLDGTLAEFRFLDMVGPENFSGDFLYEFAFGKIYDNVRPLATMQEVVKELDSDKVYVLGAITLNSEIEEKYVWLAKHYPSIKRENILFVNCAEMKVELLESYRRKLNLEYQDMVFVDDMHKTIQVVEERGFRAYHPSSFID